MRRPAALMLLTALAIPASAQAAQYTIDISNMHFAPPPKQLAVGDTIVWKNDDMFRHTATSAMGGFDLDLPPGHQAEVTLRKAGTMDVYCRFHPTMTVRLTVAKRSS